MHRQAISAAMPLIHHTPFQRHFLHLTIFQQTSHSLRQQMHHHLLPHLHHLSLALPPLSQFTHHHHHHHLHRRRTLRRSSWTRSSCNSTTTTSWPSSRTSTWMCLMSRSVSFLLSPIFFLAFFFFFKSFLFFYFLFFFYILLFFCFFLFFPFFLFSFFQSFWTHTPGDFPLFGALDQQGPWKQILPPTWTPLLRQAAPPLSWGSLYFLLLSLLLPSLHLHFFPTSIWPHTIFLLTQSIWHNLPSYSYAIQEYFIDESRVGLR